MPRFLFSLFLFLVPSLASADFSGRVVAVTDGDTIRVMHNGKAEKIRLYGVDCPEMGQAYGKTAKQFASEMVFGKDVTVKTHGKDRYGRTIGDVLLPDGRSLNHELVAAGLAWWYRRYAPHDAELERLEKEARDHNLGLWADRDPAPPWCYRKWKKGQKC